jgi:hypothetical protein
VKITHRRFLTLSIAGILAASTGCHSIYSKSVRTLIEREGEKIDAAQANIQAFKSGTDQRVQAIDTAVDDLDAALVQLRGDEAAQAMIYSANGDVANKTGVDAQALGYMVAKAYLDEHAGFEQAVKDQFAADSKAMQEVASKLASSWAALAEQQKLIADYAARSGVASIDPAVLGAAIAESKSAAELADSTLKRGREVEKALDGLGSIAEGARAQQARGFLADLLHLLEASKPKPAQPTPPDKP